MRRFGALFVAGARLTVPVCAVVLRKAYGLGAMAMTAGDLRRPAITVAWPTGEFGGMGLEGAVRLGYRAELDAIEDPDARRARFEELVAEQYTRGKALSTAAAFEIDDVIDPADTRALLTDVLTRPPPAAEHSPAVSGRRPVGRPVQQHLIQVGQDQARPGLPASQGPESVAGQRGTLGGGRALSAYIADHHSPCPPGRRKHVAEIRKDRRPGPSRRVPRGHLQAWDIR